jgi:hypothetical protein
MSVPEVLVSDSGGVFRSHDAMRIYKALGIQKQEIEKRQAWQSYIESNLYVIWNLNVSEHCQITYIISTSFSE